MAQLDELVHVPTCISTEYAVKELDIQKSTLDCFVIRPNNQQI